MKCTFLVASVFTAIATTASAFWDVQNSGEDVFGNVNVTVTSIGDNGNLMRFECGSSSEPFLAFLLRDSSGEIPEIPATFVHVDQENDRHVSGATLGSWNDQYVAVKVTDTETLVRLAEHMTVATSSISVGITIPFTDHQVADTFSSRGSTNAGQTVKEHCF
ncbi:hypothetical protein [Octadecabacter ascidiaceicola]|uniref:Invasion associated locus B (IalB) protein n=1 Tax=Octadecabacter ascidiaceicola TaxID=1655543 RepID=A0A238KN97_9RHOB|nr:hypothetical protein [Octadecabacter ascidiaceicola]SMX44293.1 hypothetical protein OCA8868_03111 [Octadecabacter ascidiaceicola]